MWGCPNGFGEFTQPAAATNCRQINSLADAPKLAVIRLWFLFFNPQNSFTLGFTKILLTIFMLKRCSTMSCLPHFLLLETLLGPDFSDVEMLHYICRRRRGMGHLDRCLALDVPHLPRKKVSIEKRLSQNHCSLQQVDSFCFLAPGYSTAFVAASICHIRTRSAKIENSKMIINPNWKVGM